MGRVSNIFSIYSGKKDIDRFCKDQRGIAAVEFALIAPIIILILVAAIELATVVSSRMAVNSSVSSLTSAVLLTPNSSFSSQYALDAAEQLKKQRFVAEATVNLNQAYKTHVDGIHTSSTEGTSYALCYCPTKQAGQLTWGPEVECNSTCADQTRAGRFMNIQVKFNPPILFGKFFNQSYFGKIDTVVRLE